MTRERVLVTGGSGFVAGHCVLQSLERGYDVRTTIRSLSREDEIRAVFERAGMRRGNALSFVEADLTRDAGWAEAVEGVDYVLHVASPIHIENVTDENEVITPAREGTLRVLLAARDAGVKRVVLTSAFHAVGFGHGHIDHVFTENDWSPLDGPGVDAYGRSKILAERAAWGFIRAEGGRTELATICPVAIMGPVMGRAVSGANHIVQRILNGELPGYPDMYIPVVDVRDVAAAHVVAMTVPGAAGQRFLVASDEAALAMKEIGAILRERFGDAAKRVPTRSIPDVVVRLAALFKAEFKPVAADLGYVKRVSNEKARRLLGLQPRTPVEAIIASAESMIAKSLVKA
ncbi:aldehyde reductase [Nonomuraea sp. NPDC050643]|uniref:SDR family oxidoreductase n=1 Tax=Nonomuraea sp. NPDC050643 TaxID=3155660 RepID=UPI0033E2888B